MLPKINYTLHNIEVPSLKKKFKFRPFLVKEEKLLLMAKESGETSDILTAIKQIVNNCAVDSLDIDKLAIFDLEYLFLQLRAVSVDNTVKVAYRDDEDLSVHEFEIDLNAITVSADTNETNVIKINKNTGIVLRYPPASIYDDKEFMNLQNENQMFELIVRCIESVYDGEALYEAKDSTNAELSEFLDSLEAKTFAEIQTFLVKAPKIEYKIQYKNNLGNDREIVLNSLNDFFIWR